MLESGDQLIENSTSLINTPFYVTRVNLNCLICNADSACKKAMLIV